MEEGRHNQNFYDKTDFKRLREELSPEELAPAVLKYMTDSKARKAKAEAALKYAQSRDAVLDYVWTYLAPLLPREDLAKED